MYYLLERDFNTGEFVTNFTMYDTSPESLVDRLWPDGLYYCVTSPQETVGHEASSSCHNEALAYDVPCYYFYRHINTGREVGVIYSIV